MFLKLCDCINLHDWKGLEFTLLKSATSYIQVFQNSENSVFDFFKESNWGDELKG